MSEKDETADKAESEEALARAERSANLQTDKRIEQSKLETGATEDKKDKPQPNVNPDG